MPAGELAIVLHTHMPYVEGFGTWPFGEEWLWEAIATSYLPLLEVLDEAPGRLTLSVTPVLADQLEQPGAIGRCLTFLREIRPESHRRDIAELRAAGDGATAAELERSAAEYAAAARRLAEVGSARRARAPRQLDLGGDARRAAAGRHRQRRRPADPDGHRVPSPALRRLARRVLAARVRVRAVAGSAARARRRPLHMRRAHRDVRRRRPAPSATPAHRERDRAVADRPVDHRPGVGAGRLSVRRGVSRLSPPHHPPPSGVADRRRPLPP